MFFLEQWIDPILTFVETHHAWGALVFGLLAFGESLVLVGVLIPGTGILIASGTLIGAGVLPFWEVFFAGAAGAAAGDAVSYWIGRKLGPAALEWRPLKPHAHVVEKAEAIFARYGWAAVFFGRFVGPLRASVPFAAGLLKMPHAMFQLVNCSSAIVWVPVLVAPGAAAGIAADLMSSGRVVEAVAILVGLAVAVVAGVIVIRRGGRRLGAGEPPAS